MVPRTSEVRSLSQTVKALTRWRGAAHPETLAAKRELDRAKLRALVAAAEQLQAKIGGAR